MTKAIIGFIGDKNAGKTLAAGFLKEKGFHKVSIGSKIEEFAIHLFSEAELNENRDVILKKIRESGRKAHKSYWVNLLLISVPSKKNLIVFDDIELDEAIFNKIKIYQIYRPGVSSLQIPDIETIINDGTKKDLREKIEELYKKILKFRS